MPSAQLTGWSIIRHALKITAERAVKAFAETLAGILVASGTGLFSLEVDIDVTTGFFAAGLSAAVSILTSVASLKFDPSSPNSTQFGITFWRTTLTPALSVAAALLGAFLITYFLMQQIGAPSTVGWIGTIIISAIAALLAACSSFPFIVANSMRQSNARARRMEAAEDLIKGTESKKETYTSDSTAGSDDVLAVRFRLARERVEDDVRRFLPSNPRTAKRMMNHLSLALAIAEARGVLREGSVITNKQLAKWIGLVEQWPPLGAGLTTCPHKMVDLENAAGLVKLQEVLDSFVPGVLADDDLRRRLHEGERLGHVLKHLVRYEPLSPDQITGGARDRKLGL